MTEITPGRVAYERFQELRAAADPMAAVTAWEHPAVKTARPWWEGAAQAAIDVSPELDRLREQLGRLQDSIGNIAAGMKLSASASRPSKKSDIEDGCADTLLALLDPR
jgi:hypothetical protein